MKDRIHEIVTTNGLCYAGQGYRWPSGSCLSITPDEGEFMYNKIKEWGLKIGYECATGTGYSSLWLGSALDKLCSIDSYVEDSHGANNTDQSSIFVDSSDDGILKAGKLNNDLGTNTKLYKGISPQDISRILDKFLVGKEKIDFVFIDGCHYGDHPLWDIQAVFSYLKKKCVVFWHDCNIGFVRTGIEYMEAQGFKSYGCNINSTYGLLMQTRGFE